MKPPLHPELTSTWVVFGDSWSAAREADTGDDCGWPYYAGILRRFNLAISGSTAREWADDQHGRLTNVLNVAAITPGPIIFSLVGNDIRHAAKDGFVSPREMLDAYRAVRTVLQALPRGRHLVMLHYCDPYFGRKLSARIGVAIMNRICLFAARGFPNIQHIQTSRIFRESDFDGRDFHPTRSGWLYFASVLPKLVNAWQRDTGGSR